MQFLQVRTVRHPAVRRRHVHTRAKRTERQDLSIPVDVVFRARLRIRGDPDLQIRRHHTNRHEDD